MRPENTIDFYASTESPPPILLPDPSRIFLQRRSRFSTLALHHSLSEWLDYLGHLTEAQHDIIITLGDTLAVETAFMAEARTHEMPPLNALSYPRPALFGEVTRRLCTRLADVSPATMRARLAALQSSGPATLETLADALAEGRLDPDALPETTIVAASLQIVWTALAARLDPCTLKALTPSGLCPCCGSLPVASVLKTSAQINNLRYLHCSLCNTEWNVTRATCTTCDTDKEISYRQIDGSNGSVRAECCDHCHSYLKIMAQEKDPETDPVADDLATLALDLLVDEAGFSRSGPNLLLLGGAG